jgi:WD40 repeat protein
VVRSVCKRLRGRRRKFPLSHLIGRCLAIALAAAGAGLVSVAWSVGCFAQDEPSQSQKRLPPIVALEIVPNGSADFDGSPAVFASQNGLNPSSLKTGIANPHDIAFSPDGHSLVVCGGEPGQSGQVEIFDWPPNQQSAKPRQVLRVGDDSLYSVAWSPDGKLLAVAGLDGTGRILDVSTGRERLQLSGHSRGLTGIEFLSAQRLVTSSLDGSVRVWDAESGELLRTLANHTGPVTAICLGPEREPARLRMVASIGDDRTVRLWQPEIGRMVRFARLPAKPLAVTWISRSPIAASHDGLLAVACLDGQVRLVAVDTAEILAEQEVLDGPAFCAAVSEAKETLIVAGHRGQARRIPLADLLPGSGSEN